MATPYLQVRLNSVASTQDEAGERLGELPVLVMTGEQTRGRGRSGSGWISADRAVAASLAFLAKEPDRRPFSLMAGVAAARVAEGVWLKWPNDILKDDVKVGGILVERSEEVVVAGLGLNLWWETPPQGMGGLLSEDPGPDRHKEVASLWAAHLMGFVDGDRWPIEEYRSLSATLGRDITWEPDGRGVAVDVADDGGLVVDRDGELATIYSGAVRHVRG